MTGVDIVDRVQLGSFPRRAIVISFLLPGLGILIVGGICLGILADWYGKDDRATVVVTGDGRAVGEFETDDTVRYDVWWKDADGDGHEAQYRVPDGSRLESKPFPVRYDPADPEGLVFPAGPDADQVIPPTPPWWVLFFLVPFVILAGGMALGWRSRILGARAAAARPGVPYRVVPFVVESTQAGFGSSRTVDVGLGTVLLPAGTTVDEETVKPGRDLVLPPGALWQRAMWTRGFATLTPGHEVTAHITEGKGGRALLTTKDGTVWPAGPLSDKPFPKRVPVKVAYRTAVNSRVAPGRAYLIAPLFGLCAAPAAVRSPLALLFLPYAILLGYSLGIFVWGWRGGIPER